MNKFRLSLAAFLGMLFAANSAVQADSSADKPNVVVFYADDLGWGDLRRHNKNADHFRYTPNLDRIFSRGIELSNYMTHAVCTPSRAGLLTGKHYAKVGSGPRTDGTLPNDIRNIAKDFQSASYTTGAFGKWHNGHPNFPEDGNGRRVDYNRAAEYSDLHKERTLDLSNNIFENHKGWKWGEGVNAYGFDRWVGYYNGGGDLFDRYVDWHHDVDWWHDRRYRGDEKGYTTDLITKYALEFIRENKDNPFFCYIPAQAVHSPIQLKRSDLKEFCRKLESELGIGGQWEYVSEIVSPQSGRRLGDVKRLRCDKDGEFNIRAIDPGKKHYAHLIYAAYIYTLDKSIGAVLAEIERLGKMDQTIFVFASDNGATPDGINSPYRGGKHSLWEGGVHVPAAIWWPGSFDASTKPYSPDDNTYDGLIAYIDLYPTLMSMSGNSCLARNLDGIDCWPDLRKRRECRPDAMDDALVWMWIDYGTLRTRKWKLFYSESRKRVELYDIEQDIEEQKNIAAEQPEVCESLIESYRRWIDENKFAMSWMTIAPENITNPDPAPEGELLEIRATQTRAIRNPGRDGVFVRFSTGEGWMEEYDAYVHPGDRVEFDIYVCEDSDIVKGCFYNPGKGWIPFYNRGNGLNQNGISLPDLELPKGEWTRQVVGVGNFCPGIIPVNYIALQSRNPGYYHYYLDNVVIRKKDGGIRSVIWKSSDDFAPLVYRYRNVNHQSLEKADSVDGFPFADIRLNAKQENRYETEDI